MTIEHWNDLVDRLVKLLRVAGEGRYTQDERDRLNAECKAMAKFILTLKPTE
jgi:hypothetical protein